MDIEEKCIAKTREYELRLTTENLESYIKLSERFELPFEGMGITRENLSEMNYKQILLQEETVIHPSNLRQSILH